MIKFIFKDETIFHHRHVSVCINFRIYSFKRVQLKTINLLFRTGFYLLLNKAPFVHLYPVNRISLSYVRMRLLMKEHGFVYCINGSCFDFIFLIFGLGNAR